jgi:hypothetical protein
MKLLYITLFAAQFACCEDNDKYFDNLLANTKTVIQTHDCLINKARELMGDKLKTSDYDKVKQYKIDMQLDVASMALYMKLNEALLKETNKATLICLEEQLSKQNMKNKSEITEKFIELIERQARTIPLIRPLINLYIALFF